MRFEYGFNNLLFFQEIKVSICRVFLCISIMSMALLLQGCGSENKSSKEMALIILEEDRVGIAVDDVGIKLDNKLEDLSKKTVSIGQFETFELLMIDHGTLPFFALLSNKEEYMQNLKQGQREVEILKLAMTKAYGDNKVDIYAPFLADVFIFLLAMQTPNGDYWNPTEHPGPSPLGLPPLEPMNETAKVERISALLEVLGSQDTTFTPAVN